MKIAVLAAETSWYLRDLQRAAGDQHQIVPFRHGDLADRLGVPRISPCDGADAVLVRTMPPGSLEQVVFRMDVLGRWSDRGLAVVNRPSAIEATVDKYLASARCEAAGLLVPPTQVCQTVEEAQAAFAAFGGDVVLKPLFGGEGRGICRLSDPDLAGRAFQTLERLGAVLYVQQFIKHEGHDLRLFVLGDQVFAMRRRNFHDWRTNVSRGAETEPFVADLPLREMALQAARAVGADMAGVDILPGCDGRHYVLEVNGVPGWKALSHTLGVDVAQAVLDYLAMLVSGKELVA